MYKHEFNSIIEGYYVPSFDIEPTTQKRTFKTPSSNILVFRLFNFNLRLIPLSWNNALTIYFEVIVQINFTDGFELRSLNVSDSYDWEVALTQWSKARVFKLLESENVA